MKPVEYVIDVKKISKVFSGVTIVKDVTLKIKPGEIFGFLGPNGSGKTTTMRMLCGLMQVSGGEGQCLGYDILTQAELIKRQVGYMPQFFGLYKNLTVYENLKLISQLYGLLNREQTINDMIDEFDLLRYKNSLAGKLSGGWKQKLSLAAALIHKPSFLLLDEPTASIDAQSRRIFWEIIHDLSERGTTIMFTSHNTEEIEHAHRISYLYKGRILMSGSIKDIINEVQLTAWSVKKGNLLLLAKQLRMLPNVDQVISFPESLRVLGKDKDALQKDLSIYIQNPNYQWTQILPNIEDVFVFFARRHEEEG